MKFNRKNTIYILSATFIGQILLILILTVFSAQNIKERSSEKKLLAGFNKDNVQSFTISDYKDEFTIEKREGSWFVNVKGQTIPGDVKKADSFIDILANLTEGTVIDKGNNPTTSDANYGFDNERYQKVTVKMKDKKSYTIMIGDAGSMRGWSYIRYNNEKKTREVKSTIANDTSNQYTQWSKRTIFDDNINPEEIAACEVDSKTKWFTGKYEIQYKGTSTDKKDTKKDDKSTAPPDNQENFVLASSTFNSTKVKPYILKNIIQNLLSISVSDYKLDGDLATKELLATIKLTLQNGKTYKMDVYAPENPDSTVYFADVDFNNYIYKIEEYELKRFIKAEDEVVDK